MPLDALASLWLEANRDHWSPMYFTMMAQRCDRYIRPALGRLPVRSVTADLIRGLVLRPLEERSDLKTARRARNALVSMFAHAVRIGIVSPDANPAQGIVVRMRRPPRALVPALDIASARSALAAIEATNGKSVLRLALRFAAVTAAPMDAVRAAAWSQFAWVGGHEALWRVPLRDGRSYLLPLSSRAVEILEVARVASGMTRLVFPGKRNTDIPMTHRVVVTFIRNAGMRGEETAALWRKVFARVMADVHPANRQCVGACLGGDGAISEETLVGSEQHLPGCRILMQEFADLLLEGFAPASSVVRLSRERPKT